MKRKREIEKSTIKKNREHVKIYFTLLDNIKLFDFRYSYKYI